MEPHTNSHMEFTWKIDKRSRINALHDFDSHMENKHIMCIIDKMAILSIMVARFDFYLLKMGKMTKTKNICKKYVSIVDKC
ncbi:hypothetical protein D2E16_09095 [Streptococcus suis]|nr:hypothetical protein D2E16_09095 [Streptococcus suis]